MAALLLLYEVSMKKTTFYRILSIISGVIALLALAALLMLFLQMRRDRLEHQELLETVYAAPEPTAVPTLKPSPAPTAVPAPEPSPEPTPEPTPEPVNIPIDMEHLQSLNSDVDGWITVGGTSIDYPVLYDSTDNMYYLNHTRTGAYSASGSIFVQDCNSRDFVDFNTVIYGHNMGNGTMFRHLHRFEDKSFFNNNRTVTIYTEDRRLTYKIFAAYTRSNTHLINRYIYETEEDRQAYIDEIYTHSGHFDYNVTVTPEDRIISLSTCTGYPQTRYIVQAVLVADEAGIYQYNGE